MILVGAIATVEMNGEERVCHSVGQLQQRKDGIKGGKKRIEIHKGGGTRGVCEMCNEKMRVERKYGK